MKIRDGGLRQKKRYGYGHPDIRHLPGGSDCKPVRFESIVEERNNEPVIHAAVDNGESLDDDLAEENDVMMAMDAENKSGGDVFKDSFDFDAVGDLCDEEDSMIESVEELFNVSFEELEDSMPTIESLEDLFSVSFEDLKDSMHAPESLDDLFKGTVKVAVFL